MTPEPPKPEVAASQEAELTGNRSWMRTLDRRAVIYSASCFILGSGVTAFAQVGTTALFEDSHKLTGNLILYGILNSPWYDYVRIEVANVGDYPETNVLGVFEAEFDGMGRVWSPQINSDNKSLVPGVEVTSLRDYDAKTGHLGFTISRMNPGDSVFLFSDIEGDKLEMHVSLTSDAYSTTIYWAGETDMFVPDHPTSTPVS